MSGDVRFLKFSQTFLSRMNPSASMMKVAGCGIPAAFGLFSAPSFKIPYSSITPLPSQRMGKVQEFVSSQLAVSSASYLEMTRRTAFRFSISE